MVGVSRDKAAMAGKSCSIVGKVGFCGDGDGVDSAEGDETITADEVADDDVAVESTIGRTTARW